jgi:hypothetical protein
MIYNFIIKEIIQVQLIVKIINVLNILNKL